MSEEKDIEEILIEAHAYGMRLEVISKAKLILEETPKMNKAEAYHLSFNTICK
jgi:hypothetical protein